MDWSGHVTCAEEIASMSGARCVREGNSGPFLVERNLMKTQQLGCKITKSCMVSPVIDLLLTLSDRQKLFHSINFIKLTFAKKERAYHIVHNKCPKAQNIQKGALIRGEFFKTKILQSEHEDGHV